MRIDVSEVKTFRTCSRQWDLSSRNRMHLTKKVPSAALRFGTLFHKALEKLYTGSPREKILGWVVTEMLDDGDRALLPMVKGYIENVLDEDLKQYKVLDVEHMFSFEIIEGIEICGSIDMVALNLSDNKIYGFEHKSTKDFRDGTYLWMDEQPRLYTIALQLFVEKYNMENNTNYGVGGIYLNEVKKLMSKFQHKRTLCVYAEDDLMNFLKGFIATCVTCKRLVDNKGKSMPAPAYFVCTMCDFKEVCSKYMYGDIDEEAILNSFGDSVERRNKDHLDEKSENKESIEK